MRPMVTVTQEQYVAIKNRERRNRKVGAIVLLSLGVAALVFTAYLESAAQQLEAVEPPTSELRFRVAVDPDAARQWQGAKAEMVGEARVFEAVAGVIGGAMAVIGVILLATMPPRLVPQWQAPPWGYAHPQPVPPLPSTAGPPPLT